MLRYEEYNHLAELTRGQYKILEIFFRKNSIQSVLTTSILRYLDQDTLFMLMVTLASTYEGLLEGIITRNYTRYLESDGGIIFPKSYGKITAANGWYNCIKWAGDNKMIFNESMMIQAIKNEHFDIVQLLNVEYGVKVSKESCIEAARNADFINFTWLINNGPENYNYIKQLAQNAAKFGRLDILKILHNSKNRGIRHHFELQTSGELEDIFISSLEYLSKTKNTIVSDWLYDVMKFRYNKCDKDFNLNNIIGTDSAFRKIGSFGSIEIIKYIYIS